MADEADSKSVVGNHVWVQVPLPAVKHYALHSAFFILSDDLQSVPAFGLRNKLQSGTGVWLSMTAEYGMITFSC